MVVAEARADLLVAERLAADRVVLEARLLPEGLLEADRVDPLERDLAVPAEDPVVPEAQAERLVVRVAVAARTPSSIPRMAKFPTRQRLARSPTT